jgi:hypothetical protein
VKSNPVVEELCVKDMTRSHLIRLRGREGGMKEEAASQAQHEVSLN